MQHVQVDFDVTDKNNNQIYPWGMPKEWDYWEFWRVDPGSRNARPLQDLQSQIREQLGINIGLGPGASKDVNDTYGLSSGPKKTDGVVAFSGTAWYLDARPAIPSGIMKGGAAKAGGLLSFRSDDENAGTYLQSLFWGSKSISAPLAHNVTLYWNTSKIQSGTQVTRVKKNSLVPPIKKGP
jgi:hypothetical protein